MCSGASIQDYPITVLMKVALIVDVNVDVLEKKTGTGPDRVVNPVAANMNTELCLGSGLLLVLELCRTKG